MPPVPVRSRDSFFAENAITAIGAGGMQRVFVYYPAPSDDVKSVTFEVKDRVQGSGKVADVAVLAAR
ncbi:hypothetical protein ACFUTV_21815 [Streptomyces sp. NPDC057298]|uniref:hypothetical protein n=1 Tax=Streptomyces sp. NPDC057298 TaxID=3346091 RepID=UPI003633C65B